MFDAPVSWYPAYKLQLTLNMLLEFGTAVLRITQKYCCYPVLHIIIYNYHGYCCVV